MATLTVWKFDSSDGAAEAEQALLQLQKQELIKVLDAAVAAWPQGAKKPKTKQLHNLTGAGALSGTFWGMLFGLIFFMPLLGARSEPRPARWAERWRTSVSTTTSSTRSSPR